jgi:hypothetical protein
MWKSHLQDPHLKARIAVKCRSVDGTNDFKNFGMVQINSSTNAIKACSLFSFANSYLGPEEGRALAEALTTNRTLTTLE